MTPRKTRGHAACEISMEGLIFEWKSFKYGSATTVSVARYLTFAVMFCDLVQISGHFEFLHRTEN
jgi:hypothetical protein